MTRTMTRMTTRTATGTLARVGAASGAVCVLSVMVGNGLALAGQSGATGGPDLLADLTRPPSAVNAAGLTLELIGWAALVMFLGYLYGVLRRAEGEDGWLAPVAFGSGLVMVTIKLGSVGPLVAAWYRRDDGLSVGAAETLSDLGDALFVVSGWATGLLVASAAGSALASRVLPRWLGWFGVVSGFATLVAGTAGILYPRDYVPLPFLAGLLWVLITSVVLTLRAVREAQEDLVPRSVRTGAAAGQ